MLWGPVQEVCLKDRPIGQKERGFSLLDVGGNSPSTYLYYSSHEAILRL